ncbi:hypothetical protein E7Z59_02770 [Robertkochia marina]|uniref:VOC domain-containing protein n=1 Tax=Robertkochia marina TaxID=1227945 RepID=A0A4S3M4M8_9FLAO|nr:VOC family protein [Robertkochia marina]THD69271.1 hypothetical protein E7Z59_02770 [Robertkochia marina]TRZ47470.1 hypothetical protein D3A96_01825 [Robertkochia marina]
MTTSTNTSSHHLRRTKSCFLGIILPLALTLFTISNTNAQDQAPASENTPEFRLTLQHTTVVVSDFQKSRDFYLGLLQLKEIPAELPENQMFVAAGDKLELHVGEVPGVEINPSTFNHFALSVSDFDGFLAYLKAKGVIYTSLGGGEDYYVQSRADGVRQTWIQDPDGYWVEFNDME